VGQANVAQRRVAPCGTNPNHWLIIFLGIQLNLGSRPVKEQTPDMQRREAGRAQPMVVCHDLSFRRTVRHRGLLLTLSRNGPGSVRTDDARVDARSALHGLRVAAKIGVNEELREQSLRIVTDPAREAQVICAMDVAHKTMEALVTTLGPTGNVRSKTLHSPKQVKTGHARSVEQLHEHT